ncbi:MAG: hypothetical protein HY329_16180 [Chloroflexi bacterium]|nr:hypothetical protein [Chloroflexota bacterium]
MVKRLVGLIAVAAVVATLWVLNCSGPKPVVGEVRLVEPTAPGAPYRVEATVRNDRSGEGQIEVKVRLREKTSGHTVQQELKADLKSNEQTLIVAELKAPAGSYTPEVEVEYPPR